MQNNGNGRVNIFQPPKTCDLFNLYDKIPAKVCATYRNATTGIWDDTLLSKTFFSNENIQIIQNGIRRRVYDMSNEQYIVAEQSCDDIKMVMRSIFLQHAKNFGNIQDQIRELNELVIVWCSNDVYKSAVSYYKYLQDVNSLVVPIDHPVLSTMEDRKLEWKKWF